MPTDKKYIIKIDVLYANSVAILVTKEITGSTMEEALSKLPLQVASIMRQEHQAIVDELNAKIHGQDDDVPF